MKMVRRLFKAQPIGVGITLLFLLTALVGPVISRADPFSITMHDKLMSPGPKHPLGTDHMGRDIASRLLYGARTALIVVLLSSMFGVLVGLPIGLVSGFHGGLLDNVLSRFTDALLALPTIILAFVTAATLGPSLLSVSLAIGISATPRMIRIVRAAVLEVKEELYVDASRASGAGSGYLLARIVLPNVMAPVIIQLTYFAPLAIMWESGMSFLGIGVQPPLPSWGMMLSTAKGYLWATPTFMLFPGLAVVLSMTGLNLFGDALRTVLDPLVRGSSVNELGSMEGHERAAKRRAGAMTHIGSTGTDGKSRNTAERPGKGARSTEGMHLSSAEARIGVFA